MRRTNMRGFIVQTMIVCIVCLGMVSTASAQSLQLGGGIGVYEPTGDAGDELAASPGFHLTGLVGRQYDLIKIEGELGMWFLQDELDRDNFEARLFPITGGIRYYLSQEVHLDGGIGAYFHTYRWDDFGEEIDDSESDFGFYGGLGFEVGGFDLKVRAHWPEFDDVYIGASIGYLINFTRPVQQYNRPPRQ